MRILLSLRTILFGIALTGCIQSHELWATEILDTLDLDVTFIGDREVLLQDAHKQLHWPEASSLRKAKPTFSYSMLPKRLNVQPEWKRNGPVRLRVDQPLPRLYQGFVQGGLGNFISPSLDFSYTDLRSRQGTWGIRGTHHSSQGGYADNDSIDDRFSSNSAEMWAKRFYGKEAVELSTHFKRERNSYFGGDTAFSVSSFPASMRYNVAGLRLAVRNFNADSTDLRHNATLSYDYLWNGDTLREHNFDMGLKLNSFVEDVPVSLYLHANIDQFNITPGEGNPTNAKQAVIDLHPSIQHKAGKISTRLGLGLWVDAQGNTPFLIVPEAEASISLLRDLFIPYVLIEGGVRQNRYQTVLGDNPFISSLIEDTLRNTYEKIHLQAGLRGSITKAFVFHLSASHERFDQFLLWSSNLESHGKTIAPLFRDMNRSSIQADATWQLDEQFTLIGSIQKSVYNFRDDSLSSAWNLPTFQTEIGAVYTWKEKVRFSSQLAVQTGRLTLQSWGDADSESIYSTSDDFLGFQSELGAYAQWNAQVEYLYNGRLSGWVHFDNLLNRPNRFLPGYNSQKFRFQMGVSYAF